MKKLIALVAVVALFAAFSISTVGKKLPSVGYVLVGPKNDGGWSMRHHQGFQSLTKPVSYTHLTLPTILLV